MYGFSSRKVAEDLRDFSQGRHRLVPTDKISRRRLREDNTRIVRVGQSSGEWDQSKYVTAGMTSGSEYLGLQGSPLDEFVMDEYRGKYLIDHCEAYEFLFTHEDTENTPDNLDNEHLKTSLQIGFDYGIDDPQNFETTGELSDRATIIVHNCSILPLVYGMVIKVSNIGNDWIYSGSHTVMGTVESTDDIITEEWGWVRINHIVQTGSPAPIFLVGSESDQAFSANKVKAYNPWGEDIPSGAKCVLGDYAGRLTILGWECL